ncbi:helix-turn-helix transcriptional regulator [Pasteurella multocida]|uniref:helix-turn-helix domain-containing protein n=1 Tax=Pasteurella multocida TaxID=747 RepID=UPI0029484906|nr:helix-turn-helix transcriptional regulator [Pasteurella multocida]MEB4492788.1 helix-turn-helix transcriptional regulator [Pasteurella multocida]MEB4500482.1 helix-turn-helix transcriptional regulator [Pasteurella multocida]MEB4530706.1 helix-turn-helix transcriptional regulator [Pasteurella multocida]MEB4534951.1 helix-turn-helix transcriptional regulator [Pasteurella multocida]MEB4561779.1 helix-turn-helix transcriptional regulator [Pasteurella multocida]
MNNNSLFSERLKMERMRLGLTQVEIASKCNISREMWGKYERGIALAGSEVLFSLASIGVDIGYLFSGIRSGEISSEEASLLDDFRNMNDQGKTAVKTTARAMAEQELFKNSKVG